MLICWLTLSHLQSSPLTAEHKFSLVVVGGGAGGCGTANKFASKFGAGEVAVIDPASEHFYQPMWTLVGGGVKSLEQSRMSMEVVRMILFKRFLIESFQDVLPSKAKWLKDSVTSFDPASNKLVTAAGDSVSYDWLVIATGLQLR